MESADHKLVDVPTTNEQSHIGQREFDPLRRERAPSPERTLPSGRSRGKAILCWAGGEGLSQDDAIPATSDGNVDTNTSTRPGLSIVGQYFAAVGLTPTVLQNSSNQHDGRFVSCYVDRFLHSSFKEFRFRIVDFVAFQRYWEISDVVTLVKSRAKVYDTDIARLVNFSSRVPRSSRAHMLVPPRVKTSCYASSFLPRVITIWNKLDVETRALGANASSPTDVAAFKKKCRLSMRNRFDQHFRVDIPCSWVMSCGCTSCRAMRPR
ncbi:hypothetical protein Bbelb_364160 [Branchiostoma belcheri]|nr:hypothetical protein Bbelb_364160 [Branchiostoma belcheri]